MLKHVKSSFLCLCCYPCVISWLREYLISSFRLESTLPHLFHYLRKCFHELLDLEIVGKLSSAVDHHTGGESMTVL